MRILILLLLCSMHLHIGATGATEPGRSYWENLTPNERKVVVRAIGQRWQEITQYL